MLSTHRCCGKALVTVFVLCLLFSSASLAEPKRNQLSEFIQAEEFLFGKEQQISKLAGGLEEWLRGRLSRTNFVSLLHREKALVEAEEGLPQLQGVSGLLSKKERDMIREMEALAISEKPDGAGQRQLFSVLNRVTETRHQALLDWRSGQVVHLLDPKKNPVGHAYFRWEASWHPIWRDEARLTSALQAGLLEESEHDHKAILQELLRLRVRAEHIACLLYTSPSPRDQRGTRMPSSA